ncbi:MAG: hypothetical protein OXG15_10275 [Gammaproteobacteria bacterium]|nr:hypothetical protein [Gammaproteobacteria bacterium]
MTLTEIYQHYELGSTQFVKQVQDLCDFCMSDTEIKRLALGVATTAEQFVWHWKHEHWWRDSANAPGDPTAPSEDQFAPGGCVTIPDHIKE